MISQADIIRTLVNKNCTDEGVMVTALSPDCTPPKLLEKLTEAERFDLALDVSMKLGLDVAPLWRTWAIRCLRNRNFQGAREKFRHCFQRLRKPGGRSNPIQSTLLTDILGELTKMDETKPFLSEEVELIKQGKFFDLSERTKRISISEPQQQPASLLISKPKIYAECSYYLKEYGNVEDYIRFYIRNDLWDDAIRSLLSNSKQINMEKFFLSEVLNYSLTSGNLNNLIGVFLELDPDMTVCSKYFKGIYNFCIRNRRYNVLYNVQSSLGDYIGAANTQLNFFYLRKPCQSYRELNQRISSLHLALKNYRDYLNAGGDLPPVSPSPPSSKTPTTASDNQSGNKSMSKQCSSSLFSSMPEAEVEKQIILISRQIDITRNFALNEVSGCVNGIELGDGDNVTKEKLSPVSLQSQQSSTDDSPVTLFEKNENRQTFLAALVLIYFDLSCSTYFSRNGLDLANQLIKDYGLNKMQVFKTALRIIIEDESCDLLKNASLLLERVKEDYAATVARQADQQVLKKKDFARKRSEPYISGSPANLATSSSSSSIAEFAPQNAAASSDFQSRPSRKLTTAEAAQAVCDEVIRDSIGSCREADYKMELAKLLSSEAKIELYIEHGKLSNAQRLACNMNRPDYVSSIIKEATRLNQNHVKTVCQLWLAKHETRNSIR